MPGGMPFLWRDLPATECQPDELWSFIHTKQENLPGAKDYVETYGDAWVWLAFAPVWRLGLGFVIGKHDQTSADRLLEQVAWVTDDTVPFFTSDQWPAYTQALLKVYGEGYCPARRDARSPSQTSTPTACRLAVCPSDQATNEGTDHGGLYRRCLWGSSGRHGATGPVAGQSYLQHQFRRAR